VKGWRSAIINSKYNKMTNHGFKEKYFAEKGIRWYDNWADYANWLEDALIQALSQPSVIGSVPEKEFYNWLLHTDNGTEHYNPHTKEKTQSIGFSPFDCFIDRILTVEQLYDRWKQMH